MSRGSTAVIIGSVAVALVLALTVGPGCRKPPARQAARAMPADAPPWTTSATMSTPFTWPGIRCPPVKPAADVKLDDDTPVAGVVVHGKARAYVLRAMSGMSGHVVNDLIGDTPVTVTYCDQTDCVSGFTADTPGKPLEVNLGGFAGKMLLKVNRTYYWQDSVEPTHHNDPPPFPYQKLALERTTWKKWRAAHPDTEVYAEPPAQPNQTPPG